MFLCFKKLLSRTVFKNRNKTSRYMNLIFYVFFVFLRTKKGIECVHIVFKNSFQQRQDFFFQLKRLGLERIRVICHILRFSVDLGHDICTTSLLRCFCNIYSKRSFLV